MDCDHARPLMTAHLGGSDTPDEWEALGHHLRSCLGCRAEAESLTQAWNALAAGLEVEPPAAVWERIQAALPAPATRPASQAPWLAPSATAALAVLVSIVASWLLPYERAVSLCSEGLRRLLPSATLPDPAVFFVIGFLYGLLPLGLVVLAGAPRFYHSGGHPGIVAGLVFTLLVLPYIVIVCGGLPAASTVALVAGILVGAFAGGPAGIWAGGRFLTLASS